MPRSPPAPPPQEMGPPVHLSYPACPPPTPLHSLSRIPLRGLGRRLRPGVGAGPAAGVCAFAASKPYCTAAVGRATFWPGQLAGTLGCRGTLRRTAIQRSCVAAPDRALDRPGPHRTPHTVRPDGVQVGSATLSGHRAPWVSGANAPLSSPLQPPRTSVTHSVLMHSQKGARPILCEFKPHIAFKGQEGILVIPKRPHRPRADCRRLAANCYRLAASLSLGFAFPLFFSGQEEFWSAVNYEIHPAILLACIHACLPPSCIHAWGFFGTG